jgi:hypothetical protein
MREITRYVSSGRSDLPLASPYPRILAFLGNLRKAVQQPVADRAKKETIYDVGCHLVRTEEQRETPLGRAG